MAQTKITKSARGEDCAFRFPDVCDFNPETTILCHINTKFKGWALKSPDLFASYGCFSCHSHLDSGGEVDPQWVMDAVFETQYKLMEKGLIKIA